MAQIVRFSIVFFTILSWCEAYKILVVFPFMGKSHSLLGDGNVKLLLEAGHEVTYITAFPKKETHPNLRQIDVSLILENTNFQDKINIENILNKKSEMKSISSLLELMTTITEKIYKNVNIEKMLNNPKNNFDVIISEWLYTEIASGFSAVFDCPYIYFISVDPNWNALSLVDEAINPAYNADIMSSNTLPFSFIQRVQELWTQVAGSIIIYYYISRFENKLYEDVFGPIMTKKGKPLPPLDTMKYNASLMLANSHVSLGLTMRLPQICKPVGGFHIDPKMKSLPENLKNIMDNARYGVIYFSMGSTLQSKDYPIEIKKGLLKMFGGLKQTVLWKIEEELTDIPNNVHTLKWAPQHGILSHPNCVIFITHGGFLSTTETVHFGIPIIGIPVAADQFMNVKKAVNWGIGKEVTLSYSLVENLEVAIAELINNPGYRNRAKELSLVYHDRVAAPGAELVHWVEHVVRTRGAPHLRSPGLMVPWYQKLYLDLIALVVGAVFVIKLLLKRMFCKNMQHSQSQKQLKKNQ